MGARYLTDLADVLRGAGLEVVEVDGWQSRARGSGGYDSGRPNHVMVHHTASGPSSDGWPDVNYCTFGDEDAPLCNLYLDRSGVVYVCAAGATNTNGSGSDPCGVTADDSMNASAIGIEAGNDGTGERWPDRQLDAYVALVDALLEAYGIGVGQTHGHAEWAPSRKKDPAGPDRYADGGATWNMERFRSDCSSSPDEEDDMPLSDDDVHRIALAVWDLALFNGATTGVRLASLDDVPQRTALTTWDTSLFDGATTGVRLANIEQMIHDERLEE